MKFSPDGSMLASGCKDGSLIIWGVELVGVVWCGVVRCSVVWCGVMWCGVVGCGVVCEWSISK